MLIRTPEDVAHLVRDRRKQLKLSQMELARRAGVSRQWLVELERGKPTAEFALVLRIFAAAGLHLDAHDPAYRSDAADVFTIADAGRLVIERHTLPGSPQRTLSTRPPRPGTSQPSRSRTGAPAREP